MIQRVYYGWTIVVLAAAAMLGTLPARTQGLGIVTEHILADLGLDRVTWAEINFWATLVGSSGAILIGRALDRFGARIVLTMTAFGLGAVCLVGLCISLCDHSTKLGTMLLIAAALKRLSQTPALIAKIQFVLHHSV